MIKKFLKGFILGVCLTTGCVAFVGLFVSAIKWFDSFTRVHHLDPLLYGGVVYILIGAIIYGVLTVKNKV